MVVVVVVVMVVVVSVRTEVLDSRDSDPSRVVVQPALPLSEVR